MSKLVLVVSVLLMCFSLSASSVQAQGPWSLSTNDTYIQFTLNSGIPVVSTLKYVSSTYNWAMGDKEVSLPAKVTVNGKAVNTTWTYTGANATAQQIEFTYHCSNPNLTILSRWESTALPGPVEHNVILTNNDTRQIVFSMPYTTALSLKKQTGHSYYHWWVEKASGDAAPAGPVVDPITGTYTQSMVSGPYSTDMETRDEVPWLCIEDRTNGSILYGGIEYSAWTEIYIKNRSGYITANMGLQPTHYSTTTTTPVAPGVALGYPPTFTGVYQGDVDDTNNRLHRWVENHLRPAVPGGVTPLIVNNSWCLGLDINDNLSKSMIDDCASLGMEMFHIDAGWYNAVGDWHPNAAKFPNGLAPIADYAHRKNIKFGLWVAWTQGGDMKTYTNEMLTVFNPAQAPWFTQDFAPDWTAQAFSGATVCLSTTGPQSWAQTELGRIATSYGLDMLEHDQPMIPDQGCQRTNHGHTANDWVDTSRAACDGYYKVYDTVRSQHSNLFFEDCVNGGRLIDFGVAKRVHYYSVTDTCDAITLRQAFYDASYPIPPSMIELYLDDNTDYNIALKDYPGGFVYMLRSMLLGWPTLECNAANWTAQQRNAAQREFATFKQKLRPLIASGNVYHVLPRPNDTDWDGIQYFDPATGKGALFIFRPYSTTGSMTIKLRGFDTTKNYLVESADGNVPTQTLSGSTLVNTGLSVSLPGEITSEIVFFTQL